MLNYRLGVAEAKITQGPAMIETTLGSCVAAVFWHANSRTGAMCHAALPICPRDADGQELRYVDYAMGYLLARLKAKGIEHKEIEVKLFGGANVLPGGMAEKTVGFQNVQAAERLVEKESLRLVASDLGGIAGRVIYFRVDTGDVFLRRIKIGESFAENQQARSGRIKKVR